MKIEQIIVQYLYANKEVTLQGIGTFRMSPQVTMPSVNDKDFTIPPDAIQFEYNSRAVEDESLINFIVQHTRKIKPLASSDLDSYIALSKQFLNIGKPFVIEGVGTVQKNMQGEYEFIPGSFVPVKMDDQPKELREKKEETVSFESESRKKVSINVPAVAVVLLVLIVAGLGIYYFIKKKNAAPEVVTVEQPAATAPIVDTVKKDTIAVKAVDSTVLKPSIVVPKDSFSFKVIIKEYPDSSSANKAYRRLTSYGHKLIVYTSDSSTYKLAMPFMNPLSDSTRIRDSIKIYFGGNPKIEL